jgi:arylsulfatase A-like enzyme
VRAGCLGRALTLVSCLQAIDASAGDRPNIVLILADLFATAAAAAGARPPARLKRDGVDLLPYLLGRRSGRPHERLFWRTGGGTAYAVRDGDDKLVKEAGERVMLFDLARDPGETHDLAASRPAIVRRLDRAYRAWNAELIPPSFPDARADR